MRLVLWILILSAAATDAATYYVATNGNNAAAGTIGAPWLTIRHGLITMAGGDTLYLRGGTHPSDGFFVEEFKSGVGANWTQLRGYPGETAIYAPTVLNHAMQLLDVTNVILGDFSIDASGATYDIIKVTSGGENLGGNIILTNLSLYGIPNGHGILTSGFNPAKWLLITHCRFYTNGWNWVEIEGDFSPLHQIYIQDSNVTVENCYFQGVTNNNGGTTGLTLSNSGCTNQIYRNSYFTNCYATTLFAGSAGGDVKIYNNVFCNNRSIGIHAQNLSSSYILNNSFYGGNNAIIIDRLTNSFVENNLATAVAPDSRGVMWVTTSSNAVVNNNLICSNLNALYLDYRTNTDNVNITFGTNRIARGSWGTNEIYNPKLVTPTTGNLALQNGSDALEWGKVQTIVTNDYLGFLRVGLPDVGAFNLGLEQQIHTVNANVGNVVVP